MIKDEHVIDNKSKSVQTQKFMPFLSNSVDFIQLGIKSKKPAQFVFHLNPSNFDLVSIVLLNHLLVYSTVKSVIYHMTVHHYI